MTDRGAEPASRQRQLPDKPELEHGGSPPTTRFGPLSVFGDCHEEVGG